MHDVRMTMEVPSITSIEAVHLKLRGWWDAKVV